MIYLVVGGEYEDWFVVGYFDNEDDALKYCALYAEEKFYILKANNLNAHLEKINNTKFFPVYGLSFKITDKGSNVILEESIVHSYVLDKNTLPNRITYIAPFIYGYKGTSIRLIMNINAESEEEAITIANEAIEKMNRNYTKEITQKEVDIMNIIWEG